jgi:hypothetical protein
VASEAYRAKNGSYATAVGDLVTGGFLRTTHTAGANGYTITYTSDGKVAASGACVIAAS